MSTTKNIVKLTKDTLIGIADADLLDNGTRHPNLAMLKLAGYFRDRGIPYRLICDGNEDISQYTYVYMSRVFTFTHLPQFYLDNPEEESDKIQIGGTGWYATEEDIKEFERKRQEDLTRLEKDPRLPGLNMRTQMPDYHLYDEFIEKKIAEGHKKLKYKDYKDYSIGFLTRGCFRHCSFCVNKLEAKALPYSKLSDFVDPSRKYIYLWDDNFFAAPHKVWTRLLNELISTGKPFQFRQGLDERLLTEESAELLSKTKYHGDFIFAFDNWNDRPIIEKSLKIWKKYNPKRGTKFYLFCGYEQTSTDKDKFYQDIWEIFQRIKVLMTYGCVGYLMRHEDYHKAPIPNIYVQIARWCNQQQFYKKQSFWEFAYRNQSYWEEKSLGVKDMPKWVSFEQFERYKADGRYEKIKLCKPIQTVLAVLEMFPDKKDELVEMFSFKMSELIDKKYTTNK